MTCHRCPKPATIGPLCDDCESERGAEECPLCREPRALLFQPVGMTSEYRFEGLDCWCSIDLAPEYVAELARRYAEQEGDAAGDRQYEAYWHDQGGPGWKP